MPWKGKIFVEMAAQMYKALEGLNPGIKIHGFGFKHTSAIFY